MSYFNSQGVSAGPIKVCTVWMNNIIKIDSDNDKTTYLAFSFDKMGTYSAPLLAGSPILDWEEVSPDKVSDEEVHEGSDGKYYRLITPPNAVITAKFLSAYTAIAPGDITFNPDDFVTGAEFARLETKMDQHENDITVLENTTSELSEQVQALQDLTQEHSEEILDIQQNLINDWFANGLVIECGQEVS